MALSAATAAPTVSCKYHQRPRLNAIATLTQPTDQEAASFNDTRCWCPLLNTNKSRASIAATTRAKASHKPVLPTDSTSPPALFTAIKKAVVWDLRPFMECGSIWFTLLADRPRPSARSCLHKFCCQNLHLRHRE